MTPEEDPEQNPDEEAGVDEDTPDPDSEEGDDAGDVSPTPSALSARPGQQPAAHADGPTEPVLQILPLGGGLVLIGLGLGLAFIALRLRRA